jgi:serine/threonine protein kinase
MDAADDVSGGPVSPGAEYTPATLAVRLRCGAVAGDDCVRWSKQLLSALACLHREGLVHRDVKPSNCLFIDGQLKLADFGLLAQVDRSVSRVGTLEYMPPDGIMDTRADVYAAGLVIYQMITGLPAHRFPAIQTRARAMLADPRLTALNRLALKACQSDRNARFADVVAMLQTFQQEVVDRTPSDRPEGMKVAPGRIRRLLGRAIVAVCLAAALTGCWLVWRGLNSVPNVDVNFITDQFDAEIWLDGRRLCQPDGEPWLTPCTVTGVSAETHAFVLKRQGLEDLELGRIDFGKTREVTAHWGNANAVDSERAR